MRCAVPRCDDGLQNGDEPDVDCGGGCSPCAEGGTCRGAADCVSGSCVGGVCRPPTCTDGLINGDEVGLDCGGGCPPCGPGQPCSRDDDCESEVCVSGACADPSCSDLVRNGAETSVDCGGAECAACPDGRACAVDTDCLGRCEDGACASCMDGLRTGAETDIDCGGGACDACGQGRRCARDADCRNGDCEGTHCASCGDGYRNQGESDVDCGGPCGSCDGEACARNDGCASGVCASGLCAPAPPGCAGTQVLRPGVNVVAGAFHRTFPPGSPCSSVYASSDLSFTATLTGSVDYRVSKQDASDLGLLVRPAGCAASGSLHCTSTGPGRAHVGSFPVVAGQSYLMRLTTSYPPPELSDRSPSYVFELQERPPACASGLRDGAETDVDCGGPLCPGCLAGESCVSDGDCFSGLCRSGVCRALYCGNGARDGAETDVDCGGESCVRCADGRACLAGSDCVSGSCVSGVCVAPSCADGVRNGDESAVDCGGATTCPRCSAYAYCEADADCASGACREGLCAGGGAAECTAFGSDRFGYRGCALSVPVSEMPCPIPGPGATRAPIGWEYGARVVPLDFEVDFYGTSWDEVYLAQMGLMMFDQGLNPYGGTSCRGSVAREAIAPMSNWGTEGVVAHEIVGQAPARQLLVQWDRTWSAGTGSVVAVVHESTGDIDFCYTAGVPSGLPLGPFAGIIHGAGSDELRYSCSGVISPGTVVRFRHP
ncbi:MAG: hypothetical protein EVA89_02210 [Sandaracinaceae bacterium]|nr:MAG: hypothetical protein EVA89_02210 [Sandaracinaceae bacterium]